MGDTPICEHDGPLIPISNYGAMKLASEAAIFAACEKWLGQYFVFFPNVVGAPATHGVIFDINKLDRPAIGCSWEWQTAKKLSACL